VKSVIKPNLDVITDFAWKQFVFFFLVDNLITTFDCGKGNRAIPEIHAFNANYFPDFS